VPPIVTVPTSLRASCAHPDPAGVATVGDMAAFSLRQASALSVCDSARSSLVQIIDGTQAKPKRKLWPW